MKILPSHNLFLKESQSVLMIQCLYKFVLKTSVNENTFTDSIFSFVQIILIVIPNYYVE